MSLCDCISMKKNVPKKILGESVNKMKYHDGRRKRKRIRIRIRKSRKTWTKWEEEDFRLYE